MGKLKDLITGLLFVIIGVIFQFYSSIYEFGTTSNMGPGYYPSLISAILMLLGIILVVKNLIKK